MALSLSLSLSLSRLSVLLSLPLASRALTRPPSTPRLAREAPILAAAGRALRRIIHWLSRIPWRAAEYVNA
eukprot:6041445-Pleurochrysis_carterae.AAC.3